MNDSAAGSSELRVKGDTFDDPVLIDDTQDNPVVPFQTVHKSLCLLSEDVALNVQKPENVNGMEMVLFDPEVGTCTTDPVPYVPWPRHLTSCSRTKVITYVSNFTVQCAICFKWRFIPTKEKYEEIRANIMVEPFVCETAGQWRAGISCADPPDINHDCSKLWALDKPSISQPPPGWERLLKIRREGSTKFADVYYVTPTGLKLRSMVEIEKYLLAHPEYIEAGVTMSHFSFQIPRPIRENYVRKRSQSRFFTHYAAGMGETSLETCYWHPLAWAPPCTDLSTCSTAMPDHFNDSYPQHPLAWAPPCTDLSTCSTAMPDHFNDSYPQSAFL